MAHAQGSHSWPVSPQLLQSDAAAADAAVAATDEDE